MTTVTPAVCPHCSRPINLRAANDYEERQRITWSHTETCRRRIMATTSEQMRKAQQWAREKPAQPSPKEVRKEWIAQPPERMLCLSCSEAQSREVPWTREHWEATGHAAISSEKYAQAQEDAVSHNYRNEGNGANVTGIPRAYARPTFAKSPGPTGVKR